MWRLVGVCGSNMSCFVSYSMESDSHDTWKRVKNKVAVEENLDLTRTGEPYWHRIEHLKEWWAIQ